MKKRFTVAGLGEILWDLLPEGKKLGGAPANFAYHAQALGAEGFVISAIGDDILGKQISDKLNRINLSTSNISIDNDHPTGTVEVHLDPQGVPEYIIHTNVAWDFIPGSKANLNLAKELDAICFGSLAHRSPVSQESIQMIIKETRRDCLKIFDINIRQSFYTKDSIEASLKISNCLKLNESEFSLLADMFSIMGSETNIIDRFMNNFNIELIALTKGKNGSVLYTPSTNSKMASPVVQVEDTVGAGDAFTSALCMGLLNNHLLRKIHQNATDIAAFVCTQEGATPIIPNDFKKEMG